jgi:hypothetical protein
MISAIIQSILQVLSALSGAAFTASAHWTWANNSAATFLAANGPAVGNDHSNSRPKQNGG